MNESIAQRLRGAFLDFKHRADVKKSVSANQEALVIP